MTIDDATLLRLRYQQRRLRHALLENNRREAEIVQRRIDAILDARPRVHSVDSGGTVSFDPPGPGLDEQVPVEEQVRAMVREVEKVIGLPIDADAIIKEGRRNRDDGDDGLVGV